MRALHSPLRILPLVLSLSGTLAVALSVAATGPAYAASPKTASSPLRADATPTQVLGFAANDHFEHAEALTKAIKQVVASSTNVKLGEGDFSLEVLTAALGCSDVPDESCLKRIASKTNSKRLLWGTLSVEGQKVKAELHLYDLGDGEKKTSLAYQANLTDSMDLDLQAIASKSVSALLGPLTYNVAVRSSATAGKLFVDDAPAGQLSEGRATLEVPGGEHSIRLQLEGGDGVEETVRVLTDGSTKVRLNPGASAKGSVGAAGTQVGSGDSVHEPPAAEPSGNAQRTWGYITLGAGGVLLATGGLAAARLYQLNSDDGFKNYRAGLRTSEDACTEAERDRIVAGAMSPADVRSTCSEGKVMEVLQIALLASGVVAAGTGLTLLLTSKDSQARAAATRFEPHLVVGKQRTDLSLLVRF